MWPGISGRSTSASKMLRKPISTWGCSRFVMGMSPPPHHNNPDGLSITELEYRRAEALNKACLTFVVTDTTPWSPSYFDAYTSEDKGSHINHFRQHLLTEKLASTFSSPHELASLVLAAVRRHEEDLGGGEQAKPQESGAVPWDLEKKGSPYPGLMHFTPKYATVFFGRDAEVLEILDRMREPEGGFIIISGESGVGKSSLVGAGLLPSLETHGLRNGERSLCVRMVPGQVSHPLNAFITSLGSFVTQAGLNPEELLRKLKQSPDSLALLIPEILAGSTNTQTLVLFLDQMEELFTAHSGEETDMFLSTLYAATQAGSLWVLATIRSDHLHYCHNHPNMLKVLNGNGYYALGPVKPYLIPDMITKPATCAGLTIARPFVERLIDETEANQANLPLLAFVLNQLYEHRKDQELREEVYDQMGGVTGAIGAHVKNVEETIHRELGHKVKDVLPKIFQSLAKVQKEEGVPTRNRSLVSGFDGTLRRVVDLLVRERLLHTEGEGGAATVSISHEKLFEAWPALREYVDTNKKVLVDRTLLESRALKWVAMGRPWFSGLATGREFRDFWRTRETATPLMKAYLDASRRTRWLLKGIIGLIIVLIGGPIWLWQKGFTVDQAMLKVQSGFGSIHVLPEMVEIPAGGFRQGDINGLGELWRNPVREVTIPPFALGRYEVTFQEYDRFAIATGRKIPGDQGWGRGRRPVINVSWDDAKAYAAWLADATGQSYRLPSESEWEYAARGSQRRDIWAGTSVEKELKNYAIYHDNSQNQTAPVGSKKPNDLDLYDMTGNVWEWVEDCWHGNYDGAPKDGKAWLAAQGGDCRRRVIRGGSWDNDPQDLSSTTRLRDNAVDWSGTIGFRLARDLP